MSLISRIDTIFVPALDTEASARWYKDFFGMTEIYRSEGHIGLRIGGAGESGAALTLVPVESMPHRDFIAFNFFSPDPEALHAALVQDGRSVTALNRNGAMIWFDFTDIAGNRVNVCHFSES